MGLFYHVLLKTCRTLWFYQNILQITCKTDCCTLCIYSIHCRHEIGRTHISGDPELPLLSHLWLSLLSCIKSRFRCCTWFLVPSFRIVKDDPKQLVVQSSTKTGFVMPDGLITISRQLICETESALFQCKVWHRSRHFSINWFLPLSY